MGHAQPQLIQNPAIQIHAQPQTHNYFQNLNLNAVNSKPPMTVAQMRTSSLEDYIERAYNKCITVAERLQMTKQLQKIGEQQKLK